MSKLSKDEILKIAKLAKISLTEEEVLKYQNQLSSVLEYVSQVSELDTSKSTEFHQEENQNRATEDKPKRSSKRDMLLKNAPMQKDGFFVVPRVIKK